MPQTKVYIKKSAQFDVAILRKSPYRGVQKEVSEELNMGKVAVHRAIQRGDVAVMKLVLQKMLEINRTIETINSIEAQLKMHLTRASEGALEMEMKSEPNRAKWVKVKKRKRRS